MTDAELEELEERVLQFQMLELPGQPMSMHMGTSQLVRDLSKLISTIRELREENAARDRVVEAARAGLASYLQWGEFPLLELEAALAALEEQS